MFVPRPWRALPPTPTPAPVLFPADLPASEEFTDGAGRTPSPGASADSEAVIFGKGVHLFSFHPDTRKAKMTSIITPTHQKTIAFLSTQRSPFIILALVASNLIPGMASPEGFRLRLEPPPFPEV